MNGSAIYKVDHFHISSDKENDNVKVCGVAGWADKD